MICPECGGEGRVTEAIPAHVEGGQIVDEMRYFQKCITCNGTGEVDDIGFDEYGEEEHG